MGNLNIGQRLSSEADLQAVVGCSNIGLCRLFLPMIQGSCSLVDATKGWWSPNPGREIDRFTTTHLRQLLTLSTAVQCCDFDRHANICYSFFPRPLIATSLWRLHLNQAFDGHQQQLSTFLCDKDKLHGITFRSPASPPILLLRLHLSYHSPSSVHDLLPCFFIFIDDCHNAEVLWFGPSRYRHG